MPQGYGFYVGGKWANPRDRKQCEKIDTAMGEGLVTFRGGQEEDADRLSRPNSAMNVV